MDQNQGLLLLSAILASGALLLNAIIRGLSTYIQALATAKADAAKVVEAAKAKEALNAVVDTEAKNRLNARDRELIQITFGKQADDIRNLYQQVAVLEHKNAELTARQTTNIEHIAEITKDFEAYRAQRHAADNEIAKKLADSELRAVNAEQARDDAIRLLQECLSKSVNGNNRVTDNAQ